MASIRMLILYGCCAAARTQTSDTDISTVAANTEYHIYDCQRPGGWYKTAKRLQTFLRSEQIELIVRTVISFDEHSKEPGHNMDFLSRTESDIFGSAILQLIKIYAPDDLYRCTESRTWLQAALF